MSTIDDRATLSLFATRYVAWKRYCRRMDSPINDDLRKAAYDACKRLAIHLTRDESFINFLEAKSDTSLFFKFLYDLARKLEEEELQNEIK